jgi:hypothetical protein
MNNYVVVTFAYLKGKTADHLYVEMSQKFQVDDSKGLSLEKIFDIITMVADSGTARYTKTERIRKAFTLTRGSRRTQHISLLEFFLTACPSPAFKQLALFI